MAAWARHRGWWFQVGHRPDVASLFDGLVLVGDGFVAGTRYRGGARAYATTMVAFGAVGGLPTMACELLTTVSNRRGSQDFHNSVALVTLPGPVPLLHVEPQYRIRRTRRDASLVDRFHASFEVQTTDPGFRARMLTPALMAWLVGHVDKQCPPGVRFDAARLIYWQYQPLDPYWLDSLTAQLPRMAAGL